MCIVIVPACFIYDISGSRSIMFVDIYKEEIVIVYLFVLKVLTIYLNGDHSFCGKCIPVA